MAERKKVAHTLRSREIEVPATPITTPQNPPREDANGAQEENTRARQSCPAGWEHVTLGYHCWMWTSPEVIHKKSELNSRRIPAGEERFAERNRRVTGAEVVKVTIDGIHKGTLSVIAGSKLQCKPSAPYTEKLSEGNFFGVREGFKFQLLPNDSDLAAVIAADSNIVAIIKIRGILGMFFCNQEDAGGIPAEPQIDEVLQVPNQDAAGGIAAEPQIDEVLQVPNQDAAGGIAAEPEIDEGPQDSNTSQVEVEAEAPNLDESLSLGGAANATSNASELSQYFTALDEMDPEQGTLPQNIAAQNEIQVNHSQRLQGFANSTALDQTSAQQTVPHVPLPAITPFSYVSPQPRRLFTPPHFNLGKRPEESFNSRQNEVSSSIDVSKNDDSKESFRKRDSSEEDAKKRNSNKKDSRERDSHKKDASKRDSSKEKAKKRDSSRENAKQRDSSKKDSRERDSSKKSSRERDFSRKNSRERDSSKKDSSKDNTNNRNSSNKDSSRKHSRERDSSKKNSRERDSSKKDSSKDNINNRNSSKRDSSRKYSRERDSSKKNSRERDSSQRDSSKDETNNRNSNKKDSSRKYSRERDSSKKNSRERDLSQRASSKDETNNRNSSKRDSSRKYSRERDSSKRDSSRENTNKRDSSKRDTSKRDDRNVDTSRRRTSPPSRNHEQHRASMSTNRSHHRGQERGREWKGTFSPRLFRTPENRGRYNPYSDHQRLHRSANFYVPKRGERNVRPWHNDTHEINGPSTRGRGNPPGTGTRRTLRTRLYRKNKAKTEAAVAAAIADTLAAVAKNSSTEGNAAAATDSSTEKNADAATDSSSEENETN